MRNKKRDNNSYTSLPLTTTISSLLAIMAVGGTTILSNPLH